MADKKIMTIGFDCSIGVMLGKAKKYRLSYNYPKYEIGLFDWSLSVPYNLAILTSKLISTSLMMNSFMTTVGGFDNELGLKIAEINYVHIDNKQNQPLLAYQNFFDRLRYLEQKTLKHYNDNNLFIGNFINDLLFDNSKEMLYDIDLNDFCEVNEQYLKDHPKIIALVTNDYRISKKWQKYVTDIRIDMNSLPEKSKRTQHNNLETFGQWLIKHIDKILENGEY